MNTMSGVANAAVTGARHLRVARNGQDAAAAWWGGDCGAIVVCDGCSAGAYSEVGARLASQFVISRLANQLVRTQSASSFVTAQLVCPGKRQRVSDPQLWADLRGELATEIGRIVERMPGDRVAALHDHFLFTIVAAAWSGDEVAVWALGDGAYALGDRVHELGPFEDNQPPYVAYDLLGMQQPAHFVVADAACGSVLVATDGIVEIGFEPFFDYGRFLSHPDALRRQLATRARATERVDWDARRIERQPATLQDDGAIALMRWA